jgi:hypothetical protein
MSRNRLRTPPQRPANLLITGSILEEPFGCQDFAFADIRNLGNPAALLNPNPLNGTCGNPELPRYPPGPVPIAGEFRDPAARSIV